MANTKISALTAASTLDGAELYAGVQSGGNVKITGSQIKTLIVGAGSVSVASGKTLTASNTLTLTGTDTSSIAFGTGGTIGAVGYSATGQIPGVTDNTVAAAGKIGQIISAAVTFASPTSLVSSGTVLSLTSVDLTAGAWDIFFDACFNGAATTLVQYAECAIHTANNAMPASGLTSRMDMSWGSTGVALFNANQFTLKAGPFRVNLAGTVTYYANVILGYSVSTANACGTIRATRVF